MITLLIVHGHGALPMLMMMVVVVVVLLMMMLDAMHLALRKQTT